MTNSAKSIDYAKLLFDVCEEENISTDILYELNTLKNMKSKEVNKLLNLPVISKELKIKLIDELVSFEINKYVLNLIKILVSRQDFNIFLDIIDEYKKLYEEKSNIQVLNVHTAKPLTSQNLDLLVDRLEEKLKKFVVISSSVDPKLIGGIKIEYNGKEVDNTIKKHLDDFSNHLIRS